MLVRMEAIINSMTLKERAKPEIIKGSRKRRIAQGCGMQVQDVNRLLKQFDDMQRMMKKMKKGGMAKMMRSMKGMMPPASRVANFPARLTCYFGTGVCSPSSRTACTLRWLRARRYRTRCAADGLLQQSY